MKKINLQAAIDKFRMFVREKGWFIVEEKEIAYGYQLTVMDGAARTPVAHYCSQNQDISNGLKRIYQNSNLPKFLYKQRQV